MNPHASQFEFRPAASGSFVRMFDLKGPGKEPLWTGHYTLQGRPMLDGPTTSGNGPNPHTQIITDTLNEAVKSLNKALGSV